MTDIQAMERRYIEGADLKAVKTGLTYMDLTLPDGEVLKQVEPRKLFPYTIPEKYIALVNKDGEEKAILRDLSTVPADARAVIDDCLSNYYFVPVITAFCSVEEKLGVVHFKVMTNHGPTTVDISFTIYQFRRLSETRLLITDNYSNRFEVPDITALDRASLKILKKYL